ncbi:MAG: hypothetical protein MPW15_03545 [Candidatus Manganitrophus sp.]|nr:hypothetical protein [Candidatus Manganitrophus sp.]
MPIYEYECEQCKTRVEVLQKLSDPPLETCSSCGGKVQKMVSSPAGLLFKGSGWYVTDYAKEEREKRRRFLHSQGGGKIGFFGRKGGNDSQRIHPETKSTFIESNAVKRVSPHLH